MKFVYYYVVTTILTTAHKSTIVIHLNVKHTLNITKKVVSNYEQI